MRGAHKYFHRLFISTIPVLILLAVATLIYMFAPENIEIKASARGVSDGRHLVAIRAVDPSRLGSTLYTGSIMAEVSNGMLVSEFNAPTQLRGKAFVIETCVPHKATDDVVRDCYGSQDLRAQATFSCPYYVSDRKSSKLANVLQQNSVGLDSSILCGAADANAMDGSVSRLDIAAAAVEQNGIGYNNGSVISAEDTLTRQDLDKIVDQVVSQVSDVDKPIVQYVTSSSANSTPQTLSLTGRVLSISGGNEVILPAGEVQRASATTDGVLSASDWSMFAAKENSLIFDAGIVRNGSTVGLMNCAAGQILKNDGASWLCASDIGANNGTYTAGVGVTIDALNAINNTGLLSASSTGALTTTTTAQDAAVSLITTSDLTQLGNQLGLTDTGVTPGTYNNVTVDARGRVTGATNISYLTSFTEQDGIVGNEVAGVVNSGGLVMTGAGTSANPYRVGLVTTCADNQLLKYTAAGGWACATDNDTVTTNTDNQTLSWDTGTNILTIFGGNTVDLTSLKDNTDAQGISLSGDTLSISGNTATVDLSKYADNTDNQTLTWDGGTRQISISGGNSITLPADQNTTYSNGNGLSLTGNVFAIDAPSCVGAAAKLLWSGTAFTCGADIDTDTIYTAGDGLTLAGTTFSLSQNGATNGQVLTWNGASGTWMPTIPTSFTDTDAQTISYNSSTRTVTLSGGTGSVTNFTLPLASGTVTDPGLLSQADWNTFNGKENVLTFSDGLTRAGNNVTLMDCAASQILQRNTGDTAWVCANQVTDTNTTYAAGTGISITGTSNTIANTGLLSASSTGALTTTTTAQDAAVSLITTSDLTQLGNQLGLTDTGVTPGTYNNVTVDARGRVTGATNISYLTSFTEQDGIVGNEVAGVVNSGGLVMTGAGTSANPYRVGLVTTCADNQLLKYTAAGGWACATDINTANTDNQTLGWDTSTNILSISGGNTVDLSSLKDNTDGQILSIAGNVISLTNGGSVTLPADQNTTYGNGNGLSLTGTVFAITAPTCTGTTAKLLWSGTAFTCSTDVDTDTNTTYTAGSGLALAGTTFSLAQNGATNGQVLTWNSASGAWVPTTSTTETSLTATDSATIDFTTSGVNGHTLTGIVIDGSITSAKIADGTIDAIDIKNGAVTTSKIAVCSVDGQILKYTTAGGWACATDATGSGTVSSVFGRTGVVTAQSGDYIASQITNAPAGNIASTTVQAALNELDTEKLSTTLNNGQIWVGNGSNVATAVTPTGDMHISSTGVTTIQSNSVALGADTTGNYASGATAGSGITVTGTAGEGWSPTIAINAPTCTAGQYLTWSGSAFTCGTPADTNSGGTVTSVTAGTGMTGGTITNTGTIGLANTGVTAGTYGSGTSIPVLTVNAQGQVTAATTASIPTASATTTGLLTGTDWTTFNGKENILTFSGPLTRSMNTVSLAACSAGQVYQYNGTSWACTTPATGSTYTAGSGLSLASNAFSINCATGSVAFCKDGNSFGADTTIGTNDGFGLNFETNGVVAASLSATGEMVFKDASNNAASFQVQDSSALPHFTVNTATKSIQIGSSTTDANAIALVLDSYNVATDPTGVNGAMYYNSALGKFRCYENGAWADCLSSYPQLLVDANRSTAQALTTTAVVLPFTTASTNTGTVYNTTSGIFTAPAAGTYEFVVHVTVGMPASTSAARGEYYIDLYNVTGATRLQQVWAGDSNSTSGTGFNATTHMTRKVVLAANQQISVRIAATSTASAKSTVASAPANTLQITRIR